MGSGELGPKGDADRGTGNGTGGGQGGGSRSGDGNIVLGRIIL